MTIRKLRPSRALGALLLCLTAGAGAAGAQSLGVFRWQLQPYCNVVTVTVVQNGGQYHLDGTDDQCGAAQRASLVGMAFPNPDGSIGFGFTVVTAPGGTPIHVDARVSLASVGGPWRDSAGNSGTLVLTPGAGNGGAPRPVPAGGIAPGTITGAQLAPGSVGATQLAPGAISTSAIAAAAAGFGTCPAGQYLRGIRANGSVICEPIATPPVTTTVDDPPTGAVGDYASVAIGSDGLPIISHRNDAGGTLRVTHCGNTACTSGSSTVVIPGASPDSPRIAVGTDGLPVIAFSEVAGELFVHHCSDRLCTGGTTTAVDTPASAGGEVGRWTSLTIGRDGFPIISHQNINTGALRVTHCGNVACNNGNTSTTVDDQVNFLGERTSIAIGADGLPFIAYRDVTAGTLLVLHCSIEPTESAAIAVAIGVDGLPLISHRFNGALRVVHCGNALCSAGNVSTAVDTDSGLTGYDSSVAIGSDGLPVLSHRGEASRTLRFTRCGNAACSSGNTSFIIDDADLSVGSYTSIAIGTDGLPVIAHKETTTSSLRVTKCLSRSCQ